MNEQDKQNYYEYLAHQIEREDGLVNYRLTWMLTTQGLLFAALALLAGKEIDVDMRAMLAWLLPRIGIALSVIALLGVSAANNQITYLKKKWEKLDYVKAPRPYGGPWAWRFGLIPSLCLPVLFFAAWIYVL